MKLTVKILLAVLVITAIVPLAMSMFCLFRQEQALAFFNLAQLNTDVEKLLIVLGCFILATAIFQVLAIFWLLRGKVEGLSLSGIVGIVSIGRGIMLFILLQNSRNIVLSAMPMVFGGLILLLTLMALRQQKTT